ncbi:DUF6214 family protein [Streptomyces sp. NPDC052109]|uniref:DUF6214 family protein n=1 Tax=Streptomyces sp. NPDC052109 TaxID=3155527 RepID=UPI00343F6965
MWPAWKVRERDDTTSWFHVRLAFPDGARVDALAVVHERRVSIEDVSAEPALSLADLTALSRWIEGPLFASCGVERPHEGAGGPCEAAGGEPYEGDGEELYGGGGDLPCEADGGDLPCESDGGGGSCESDGGERPVDPHGLDAGGEERNDLLHGGPRRGRPGWPRGIEGCRLVAQRYRAAQQEGVDPVLAVMTATGRSRRRSLRLIAQARDAGFLTPRHVRRG